jgi:polyhydroxybutyrate depolymerase
VAFASRSNWIFSTALCVAVLAACAAAQDRRAGGASGATVVKSLEAGGETRTYRLRVPPRTGVARAPMALVLVFHGGGGDGRGTERLTRFSELADREGFLVVYPDGLERNWNDGRESWVSNTHRAGRDDLGFVIALIDAIGREYPVDPRRVFATGISNGAIFSHYLAANFAERIAAIAPVVGGIAEPFAPAFKPARPVAVLIIQGTDDPLTPYNGGGIARGARGRILSTDQAIRLWTVRNACQGGEQRRELPDTDPTDGCRVQWSQWSGCRDGADVQLYRMVGGGHTWPGGSQYLPERMIGKVCRDFDATETIWRFFAAHGRAR